MIPDAVVGPIVLIFSWLTVYGWGIYPHPYRLKLLIYKPLWNTQNMEKKEIQGVHSAHDRIWPLFEDRSGSSVKKGIKLLRSAISCLYNNQVEKMLCSRAQDYRWNFLAYAHSRNPFSNKIIRRETSGQLRRIIKEIDYEAGRGMYLSYPQLRRLLSGLAEVKYVKSDREYRELIRYVREHGFKHAGDVISLSDDEKFDLYGSLSACTSANRMQIGQFLHF